MFNLHKSLLFAFLSQNFETPIRLQFQCDLWECALVLGHFPFSCFNFGHKLQHENYQASNNLLLLV